MSRTFVVLLLKTALIFGSVVALAQTESATAFDRPALLDQPWSGLLPTEIGALVGPRGMQESLEPDRPGFTPKLSSDPVVDERWGEEFATALGCDGAIESIVGGPNGELYVGGTFRYCAGVRANRVIRYDPVAKLWFPLGSGDGNGVNDMVRALALGPEGLYVGGLFTEVNTGKSPVAANRIALWDPLTGQWQTLGSGAGNGVDNAVVAIELAENGDVYVGGFFQQANVGESVATSGIARWRPAPGLWEPLVGPEGGQGVFGAVLAIAITDDAVFAGGQFSQVNVGALIPANQIARWDPAGLWSPLGSTENNGSDAQVFALLATDDHLFVGGLFETVSNADGGIVSSPLMARWSLKDSQWSGMGGGLENEQFWQYAFIEGITQSGREIYVGGRFTHTGDGLTPLLNIARWNLDTESWSTVDGLPDSGVSRPVYALATDSNGRIIVGGPLFEGMAQGQTARITNLSAWEPASNSWTSLNGYDSSGVAGQVLRLTELDGKIYASGLFHTAGLLEANSIAGWNGSTWSLLGTPENNGADNVTATTTMGGELYAAGEFDAPGCLEYFCVVRFDRDNLEWIAIGSTLGVVRAMASLHDELYIAGTFLQVRDSEGEIQATNVARWNRVTGSWSILGNVDGNGLGTEENFVSEVAVIGNDIYFTGGFLNANDGSSGEVQVNSIARWDGDTWSALDSGNGIGVTGGVYAVTFDQDFLYVGGQFQYVNSGDQSIEAWRVGRWDLRDHHWSALGGGVGNATLNSSDVVLGMAASGDELYVGGRFAQVDGVNAVPASNIARWNGRSNQWRALGSGIERGYQVSTLLSVGADQLYVGGSFSMAGNKSSASIARYTARGMLDVQMIGEGGGSIVSSPTGVDCPGQCSALYDWDQMVTLTVWADATSSFAGWSEPACGTSTTCVVDFRQATSLTATFASEVDLFANGFE